MSVVSEQTFLDIGDRNEFKVAFRKWLIQQSNEAARLGHTSVVLKHPLSAFLIREIQEVCAPYWVLVTRPFVAIEATRLRRQWPANYGAVGAQAIYGSIFTKLIECNQTALMLSFHGFVEDQNTRRSLVDYLGAEVGQEAIQDADGWIRK